MHVYANRSPKIPSGKITEGLIIQHAREARRKLEGNKKFADDMSAISSIHSNVSRALRVGMPTKPKKTLVFAPPQPPTETVIDFATPMVLRQTSTMNAEPTTRTKQKAALKAMEAIQPSHKRKRSSPSVTESDEPLTSTQTCRPTVSSTSEPSRQKQRQMVKQQQMQNKLIVSTIQKQPSVIKIWNQILQ